MSQSLGMRSGNYSRDFLMVLCDLKQKKKKKKIYIYIYIYIYFPDLSKFGEKDPLFYFYFLMVRFWCCLAFCLGILEICKNIEKKVETWYERVQFSNDLGISDA
jgi:hypothetical protein